eukprot:917704_1
MVITRSQAKEHVEDKARSHSADTAVEQGELEEIIPLSTFENVNEQLDDLTYEKSTLDARTAVVISKTIELKKYLSTCFLNAIESGDLALVKTLLSSEHLSQDHFVQKDTDNSPLHLAVLLQRPSIVQFLVSVPDMNVNPFNREKFTPLMCAV